MLIEGLCQIHTPASFGTHGITKEIFDHVSNDVALRQDDVITVVYWRRDKPVFSLLFLKSVFTQLGLMHRYDLDVIEESDEEADKFWDEYGGISCVNCIEDYQKKYNIDLLSQRISALEYED